MKKATVYSTPSGGDPGYVWKWRCDDENKSSAKSFALYHDCLTDAREHGYFVQLTQAQGVTAPAGAGYALDRTRNGK